MNKRQRDALARRARTTTGPVFRVDLECLACGAEGEAFFREAPEVFKCDLCGKRAVVRADAEPYPEPPEPLPM